MAALNETVDRVLQDYAGEDLNGYSYLTWNADRTVYAIISVGAIRGKQFVDTDLIVRLVDDRIVIDRDANSKPLVDALMQAGVPRRQIVLTYAGESIDDAA